MNDEYVEWFEEMIDETPKNPFLHTQQEVDTISPQEEVRIRKILNEYERTNSKNPKRFKR